MAGQTFHADHALMILRRDILEEATFLEQKYG
jgi:hypothetical protein